jgi:YggT family protein
MTAAVLVLADARNTVANYVQALIYVYLILIFAYIVTNLLFSFGARLPYSRPLNAVLEFLRDVCEPFLRIFRRFIPMAGPIDLSPIVAIIVLQVVGQIVVNVIRG